MKENQFERNLEKFSLGGLEVLTYPQNIEWEEKIKERTENFTKCAVIKDDADGPHVPWLLPT